MPTRPWLPASAKWKPAVWPWCRRKPPYDASQVGLEVGTRTVLDVVQNQRTLFQAQLNYAQSRYTFLQNRLLLGQAIGKLDITDLQDVNRLLSQDAESKLQGSGSLQ